jgi:hypothetical protein
MPRKPPSAYITIQSLDIRTDSFTIANPLSASHVNGDGQLIYASFKLVPLILIFSDQMFFDGKINIANEKKKLA